MSAAPLQTAAHTGAAAAQGFDAAGALVQMSAALGGVLLVIVLAAWCIRKLGLTPAAGQSRRLRLRASCALGQRERVVVIEVEGTWLVLGVTPQQITPLHSLPAPAGDDDETPSALAGDFRQRLRQVLLRTGKAQ
ncbi:flagellar biosynthetic protein FliO [Martelella alba]|uniref:Flagellar protein n=1 Tax=Martelella alba TaxID=2590451 RepID=A0ABY2SQB7_9HYPH|nr:flagellar biosynthetic protein FliO [Martelella alba]TKI08287.1 flagellar biosynthetic protein FliO [Martelella alba]